MEPKYRTFFMLAIMSGARQGEILGLKWTDIDWFNSQIRIQRTFNKGAWYQPKTRKLIRNIDLGPAMMQQLREWKLICPENELGLVFPNRAGQPINQANLLNRHFFPALEKAEIERIRFHDLRHTFASLLIEQGANIKYTQSRLGFSSPTVIMIVYAHLLNLTNPKSARRLEETIMEGHTISKTLSDECVHEVMSKERSQ